MPLITFNNGKAATVSDSIIFAIFSCALVAAIALFSISSVDIAFASTACFAFSISSEERPNNLLASAISFIPAALAIAICSNLFISLQFLPEREMLSLNISILSASVAVNKSTELRRLPPRIAFNLPAASAAPSNVSNCCATPIKLPISIPVAFDWAASSLNICTDCLPYCANFGIDAVN